MKTGSTGFGIDSERENRNRTNLLNHNKKDIGGEGEDLKSIPNKKPYSGDPNGIMGGPLMTWTDMLESMNIILSTMNYMKENPDIMDSRLEEDPSTENMDMERSGGDEELLNSLNQIFTPILVMQGFETDITSKIQEAFSEASVLLERNIIQFDDATRMAQLRSVCALLIARQKRTQKYQMYEQAAKMCRAMKLDIQKEEYTAASALAQRYLVMVSTTSNSSVARQAATNLLPETQH